jgi:hypothetical protein
MPNSISQTISKGGNGAEGVAKPGAAIGGNGGIVPDIQGNRDDAKHDRYPQIA